MSFFSTNPGRTLALLAGLDAADRLRRVPPEVQAAMVGGAMIDRRNRRRCGLPARRAG
jgi:hypothetical protein